MKIADVTKLVDFEQNDDEALPITRCICGQKFDAWDFIIGIYEEWAKPCPHCGRKLYFTNSIKVYQVEDEND